jgi:hypothetical protein
MAFGSASRICLMLQLQSQGKEFSGMMLDKGQTEADEIPPYK